MTLSNLLRILLKTILLLTLLIIGRWENGSIAFHKIIITFGWGISRNPDQWNLRDIIFETRIGKVLLWWFGWSNYMHLRRHFNRSECKCAQISCFSIYTTCINPCWNAQNQLLCLKGVPCSFKCLVKYDLFGSGGY